MKKCSRCKKEKSLEEFNYKNKPLQVRQKSCKQCTRQEIRNHYNLNKKYYVNKAKKRNQKIKEQINKYIWEFLITHPCIDCGEKDPVVLDFDHQRDKISSISKIATNKESLEKLINEIEKCVVRCANCHRRKTARDFNWYKHKFASVV